MNFINFLLKYIEPERRLFEFCTNNPLRTQKKVLLRYIRRNKNTEFGSKFNFSKIRSIEDYRAMVPISNYEEIRPYIDKIARGDQGVLTKDKVVFFGATSGTTNLPKLIPTTNYSERIKDHLMSLWSYYIVRDHPDVLDGKILAIVSPEIEGKTEAGIPFGAESGYSYKALPKPVANLYALPYEVFDIEDYEARHYAILRISLEQNITDIATLNPNMIILLLHKIEKWQDMIIDDISSGGLSERFAIAPEIRATLTKRLRQNPKRANELKNILKTRGKLLPKYFWPNMKIIECWQGGMMKLYLKELDDYFGPIPKRDIGCVSTEARASIPIKNNRSDGVLAILTNFYEFIPKEDALCANRRALICTELEVGKEYFIVVTTAGGLYRYNIDDIIKVTGFFNKTPTIEFVQKGLGATSLAGEKLYASHVNDALAKVLESENFRLEFFCAVTKPAEGPRYAFLVEFSEPAPSDEIALKFLASIEEELGRQDREYVFVRKAQLLAPPSLKILKSGSFEAYRARKIASGRQEGQFKFAELTSDANFETNFEIERIIYLPGKK